MRNILIVEDDWKLNDGIKLSLRSPEYHFFQCRTLNEAKHIFQTEQLHLLLLDINLPDGNGLDFLSEIREQSDLPIIIITANNLEMDIVMGLELGANDYITKPFSLMVLRARVGVQLRNMEKNTPRVFEIDSFYFDFDKMLFRINNQVIELSKTEQRLLFLLLQNRGATLTRSTLMDKVWSYDSQFVDEHALTVTIKRLRDKIETDSANPVYIKTVYGIGYTWWIGK